MSSVSEDTISLIEYLETQDVFNKYLCKRELVVGSRRFAPIIVWKHSVDCFMDSGKDVFNKLFKRVVNNFEFVRHARFIKTDGSYPNYIRFEY